MATRSRIGVELPNGTVKSIYCHWDGYVEHNGSVLVESYDTPEKITALLNRGDLSFLDKTPEASEAYRDRGEADVDAIEHSNIDDFISYAEEAYVYLFRNEEWWVGFRNDGKIRNFEPVKNLI